MMTMSSSAICCQPGFWALIFLASLGVLLLLGLVGGLARAAWLLAGAGSAIGGLVQIDPPGALIEATGSAGLPDVRCVVSPVADGFCAGTLSPRVYVTTGLLERVGLEELRAILIHEAEHARRRDPLRRALARGLSQSFFFVPLVSWWSRRQLEQSEVLADRRAIEKVGRRPVAAALWALGTERGLAPIATFSGSVKLRVAQILGDPLPRPAPNFWLWIVSAAGLTGFTYLLFCPVAGLLGG